MPCHHHRILPVALLALGFCAPQLLPAQCYQFASGSAASFSVDITSLPAPSITSDQNGGSLYTYAIDNITSGSATGIITIGSIPYSSATSAVMMPVAEPDVILSM